MADPNAASSSQDPVQTDQAEASTTQDGTQAAASMARGRLNTANTTADRVFTIFCHGTGSHRDGKCLEMVTEFGAAYWYAGSVTDRPINLDRYGRNGLTHAEGEKALKKMDPSHDAPPDEACTTPDKPADQTDSEDRDVIEGNLMGNNPWGIARGAYKYFQEYHKTFLILDGCGDSDMDVYPKGHPLDPKNKKQVGVTGYPNPMPGDFWGNTLDKKIKCKGRNWRHYTPRKLGHRVSLMKLKKVVGKNRGAILGDGWNDNVCHALLVLRQRLITEGGRKLFPNVINLVGWSRGSVTALKLAYWIDRYFVQGEPFLVPKGYDASDLDDSPGDGAVQPVEAGDSSVEYLAALTDDEKIHLPDDLANNLQVNIFAVDPVPGRAGFSGDWGGSHRAKEEFTTKKGEEDYRTIPKIVNNCIITLAIEERREGFHVLDQTKITITGKRDNDSPNVVWLPFPGRHRTQVRLDIREPDDEAIKNQLTAVPKIVFDLAWRFLEHHGTKFEKDLSGTWGGKMSVQEVVEEYSEILIRRSEWHETRNTGPTERVQGGYAWRKFTGFPRGVTASEKLKPSQLMTSAMGTYTLSPGFFINEHHRWCFELAYPKIYKFLVENVGTWEECLEERNTTRPYNSTVMCMVYCYNLQPNEKGHELKLPPKDANGGLGARPFWGEPAPTAEFTGIFNKMKRSRDQIKFLREYHHQNKRLPRRPPPPPPRPEHGEAQAAYMENYRQNQATTEAGAAGPNSSATAEYTRGYNDGLRAAGGQ